MKKGRSSNHYKTLRKKRKSRVLRRLSFTIITAIFVTIIALSVFSLSAKARGEEVTLLNRLIAAKCVNAVTAQSAMHGLDLQRL